MRKSTRINDITPLDESMRDEYNHAEDFMNRDWYESINSRIRRKIADLSYEQRNALIMYYLDGLSVSQVAEKLRITQGNAKKRLFNARKKNKKGVE